MFWCCSLETSYPLPQSPKVCSVHLYLFFCFAYRVIIIQHQLLHRSIFPLPLGSCTGSPLLHVSAAACFPGDSDGKEPACDAGDLGLIPGLGRSPGGGHGNPLQYPCLENPHGQTSLVGHSPRGGKELAMTEWLSTEHAWGYLCSSDQHGWGVFIASQSSPNPYLGVWFWGLQLVHLS